MKILYVSKGDHVDYQDDCLCIGLKELFGADVVDVNKREHIYTSFDKDAAAKMYGKGMSVTRVVEDLAVDRTDIANKLRTRYFDYIVYGSIHRCSSDIMKVLEYYPPEKVVVVDGEDEMHILKHIYDLGVLYFKRELIYDVGRLFPISFAIPTSKVTLNSTKTRNLAICDPRDRSTYIYKDEQSYYGGYQEARFGVTMKKAGWDCMRHYEILANDCIPMFLNLQQCPERIMTTFPKELCIEMGKRFEGLHTYPAHYAVVYDEFIERFRAHTIANNTTTNLAKYVLNTIK